MSPVQTVSPGQQRIAWVCAVRVCRPVDETRARHFGGLGKHRIILDGTDFLSLSVECNLNKWEKKPKKKTEHLNNLIVV